MELALIDCENCSIESVKNQIKHIIYTDIFLVVGALQSETRYRNLGININTIKCNKIHKDAADFVLIAALVKLMMENEYNRATIISNDIGYDSAIEYLKSTGLNVRRCSPDKDIMSKGLASLCGYIAKNINSGTSFNKVIKTCKRGFSGKTHKMINELAELGLIKIVKVKTLQVYFSKAKLKEIAKSNANETWYNK